MLRARPHACHERSFSAPIRRKIYQKGIHYQFGYDSDSVRSEAYTEPTCGAENRSFKDSGYNTLDNTPTGSPRSIIDYLSLEGDEITPAPPTPVVVNARLQWHEQARDQPHSSLVQNTAQSLDAGWTSGVNDSASSKTLGLNSGYEQLPGYDGEAGAWMDACCANFFTRSLLTDGSWQKQESTDLPESSLAYYDNAWIVAPELSPSFDRAFDRKAAVQGLHAVTSPKQGKQPNFRPGKRGLPLRPITSLDASKPSTKSASLESRDRRLSRYLQRFRFWRSPANNGKWHREDNDAAAVRMRHQTTTLAEEEVAVIGKTATRLGLGPSNVESQEATTATTELSGLARAEPVLEESCSASPTLPSDLPSAIAALVIEHTASQPSSSLDRTPDSSRTLNTLSEGEMSFMGVDNADMSRMSTSDTLDREMAECLEDLAGRIVSRCLRESRCSALRKHGGHQVDSCTSSSSSSSTHSTPNVTPVTSATNTPVRPSFARKNQDDHNDEGDARRRGSAKRKHSGDEPRVKLFACPFAKLDPSKYSRENLGEPNYWNCGNCCLRDISRLKQHLYRVHSRPTYYCGSCFQPFNSREVLDQHTRQRPPCELSSPKYDDRMTDNQFQAIKRRVIRGDPYELWFHIFQILFPDGPKPLSPYVSTADAATINHFVTLFRWFGPEEMMSMLTAREARPSHPLLDLPTQAVVDEAFEIALPDYLGRRRSSLQSANSTDIQARQALEVLEEDVLTMAPYERRQAYEVAAYQLQDIPPQTAEQVIGVEMEDSTPRAVAFPSANAAALETALLPNNDSASSHGWPRSMQAAFDSYMPFGSEMLYPSRWAIQTTPGILGGDQKVDAEAPPDYNYHWDSGGTC